MADTFIYHGPNQTVSFDIGSAYLRDGQYIFLLGVNPNNNHHYLSTYVGSTKVEFGISRYWDSRGDIDRDEKVDCGNGGYFQHISRFNWDQWGSKWYHSASGGCMYTIRKTTYLKNSYNQNMETLNAGDVVIIGERNTQGQTDASNNIRCWGYRRGGVTGAETETWNLWCQSGYLNYPSNYNINTF